MSLDVIHPLAQTTSDAGWYETWSDRKLRITKERASLARAAREASYRSRTLAQEDARREAATDAMVKALRAMPLTRQASIIAEVAALYELAPQDLRGRSRIGRIAVARQEAMWRLKHDTALSLTQIGRALGGRDHSTVHHGIGRHQSRLDAAALASVEG